jgi:hypothetical protein
MGRPSKADFYGMLKKGKLFDNSVTMQDYENAEKMYRKDLGVIKGKTVREKPKHVSVDIDIVAKEKLNIVLAVDVMHFTSLNFLVTVSHNLQFITATILPDRKKKTIEQALKQVISVYQGRGHTVNEVNFTEQNNPVHTILADNEFETIRDGGAGRGSKCHSKGGTCPRNREAAQSYKRTCKSSDTDVTILQYAKKMRIALIHNVVFWLNNIPKAGQDYSTKDLVFGKRLLHYKTICRIPFGAYAQVHDDPSITNTMESRTTGAISLGTTGNIQGTYRFLNLQTGEIIARWT